MMRTRIKWRRNALRDLRCSPEVVSLLAERAERIADAAGPGFETRPPECGTGAQARARVAVVTATYEARASEARGRTLTRAIEAGRG